MQNIRRLTFKPLHIFFGSVTRNNTETCWHVGVKLGGVDATLDEIFTPKQRTVIQDGVISGECHVVGQAWSWQRNWCVVGEFTSRGEHPVMHVGVRSLVVKKQQLTCLFVDF